VSDALDASIGRILATLDEQKLRENAIALLDGKWKLIEWSDGKESIFNLRTDISEMKDVLAQMPDLVMRLTADVAELKKPARGQRPPRARRCRRRLSRDARRRASKRTAVTRGRQQTVKNCLRSSRRKTVTAIGIAA
jgi:chorismate mutase